MLRLHAAPLLVPQDSGTGGRGDANANEEQVDERPRGEVVGGARAFDRINVVSSKYADEHEKRHERRCDDRSQPEPAVGPEDGGDGEIRGAGFEPDCSNLFLGDGWGLFSGDEGFDSELQLGEVGDWGGYGEEEVEHGEVGGGLEAADEEDVWGRSPEG